MTSDKRRLDISAIQFAPHESRGRTFPDRVFDIDDRCHQRKETKITLNHREKPADPSTITCSQHTELFAPALAQCRHQLPQFDYPLAQPLCMAKEIGSDREFTIPVAARDPRKVIREVKETSVPAKFVEAFCATAMPGATGRHERVQQQHRGRADPATAGLEELRVSNVVCCKMCPNRAVPRHRRVSVYKRLREIRFVRRGVIFLRSEPLAFLYVTRHLLAAATIQPMP